MTTDIARFDQFAADAPARIEAAQTTNEVQQVLTEAKVLAAAARAAKNKEYEEMAKSIEAKALNRLGRMMAAQRDAGMMKVGRPRQKNNGVSNTPLHEVGIDKNLAKAARKAYPEGWPSKPRPQRMTANELQAAGLSPHTDRYHTGDGKTATRVKWMADRIRELEGLNSELETEVARLRNDLEALQTGNLIQMSRAAIMQRRELIEKMKVKKEKRKAVETVPDEKTKEAFERQIKVLQGQLKSAKSTVAAFMQNGKTVLDRDARKSILVCLHPDGIVDPNEKAKREKAFKLFSAAIPEPAF